MAQWLVQQDGNSVAEFIARLSSERDFDEATALIKLLAAHGNRLGAPRSRALGDGLFELRGKQVRIFYVFRSGKRIVLLDGMTKKRDAIPGDVLRRIRARARQVP